MLIDTGLLDRAEISTLVEAGHTITEINFGDVDLILSPRAWRMTPELLPYLSVAIRAAQVARYAKEKSSASPGNRTE